MFFITIENEQNRLKVERLYFEYRRIMFVVANEILHDKQFSEDAVQESFIRIIKNLHKIDENNCPQTRNFLVVICRNVAKDIYRSKICLNVNEDTIESTIVDNITNGINPLDIVITQESVSKISQAIEKLDPIYRDVFLLRRVYKFSREEIARLFGISIETVKKRLVRAKRIILNSLEREKIK